MPLNKGTEHTKENLGVMIMKECVHVAQNSCITEASASDCLLSYLGPLLEESYSFAEMQSVYCTTPT